MTWAECLADQLSTPGRMPELGDNYREVITETEHERPSYQFHSKLALAYLGLKAVARENYFDFDWKAWADAAYLVQQQAECFYAKTLLADDFQTISKAYSLDVDLAKMLAISNQLLVDFGEQVSCLSEELTRVQQQHHNCFDGSGDEPHSELELNAQQLVSAWKQLSLHLQILEGLSSDIQLAYSPHAVDAAKQNQCR